MKIDISESRRKDFLDLARLPAEHIDRLVASLKRLTMTATASDLRKLAEAEFGVGDSDAVVNALDAVLSTYTGQVSMDLQMGEFIDSVAETLYNHKDFVEASPLKIADFIERLDSIVRIEPLAVVGRARTIFLENERNYVSGRVLTDMRPIFSMDANPTIQAATIIQNLKISYYQDDDVECTMFFALDENDTQSLIDSLTRAKAKAAVLKELLRSANIPYRPSEAREG